MPRRSRRGLKKQSWVTTRLANYECKVDKKRGKGSHFLIRRRDPADGRTLTYVLPHRREYGSDYINALRRHLKLRPEDGVSDEDFYGV